MSPTKHYAKRYKKKTKMNFQKLNCQANKFFKTPLAIRFNLQICSTVPPIIFAVFIIHSFHVLSS